ncbi:SEC-C domain-containing protein [Campylobacter jejuni]|nr:SEC-C domain-containing protein [Campylobacter jejuni]HEC1265142.1 SEC-C domain-containing protein [Campylobacter coli]EAH4829402.1 hypothetical protein [Campylobacter jejuni]EAH5992008.1 hypothetical protein [Campylobacter jejuni]EAH6652501.1 hypothetical protein [Campylobacter jejuni]EAH7208790.1 hypothetical protein [Campylobacter jejuni]
MKGKDRNKLCWCGSGKKFKKCHIDRENQSPIRQSDFIEINKKVKNKKICMAPEEIKCDCSKKIIKAHTISKNCNLKSIADEKNNLATLKLSNLNIEKAENPICELSIIGINKASTYQIFCSKHDAELFSVLENKNFKFENIQIFMLAYRNLCYELYLKESILDTNKERRYFDKGKPIEKQLSIQMHFKFYDDILNVGIRDLKLLKEKFDLSLINRKFDCIRYYSIEIDSISQFMGSCIWFPIVNFDNTKLADLENIKEIFNPISASIINVDNKSLIIFSWLKDFYNEQYCMKFISSLNKIPNDEKSGAILHWFFSSVENLYFQLSWWNNLKSEEKNILINFYKQPMLDRFKLDKSFYKKCSHMLNWNILNIKHNLNFINY